jgi:uncharacterized protein YbaA (DUF1428 family)
MPRLMAPPRCSWRAKEGHDIVVTVLLADPRVDVNLAQMMAPPRCISRAKKDTAVVTALLADPRVDVNLARLMAPPRCSWRAQEDTRRSSLRCSPSVLMPP